MMPNKTPSFSYTCSFTVRTNRGVTLHSQLTIIKPGLDPMYSSQPYRENKEKGDMRLSSAVQQMSVSGRF